MTFWWSNLSKILGSILGDCIDVAHMNCFRGSTRNYNNISFSQIGKSLIYLYKLIACNFLKGEVYITTIYIWLKKWELMQGDWCILKFTVTYFQLHYNQVNDWICYIAKLAYMMQHINRGHWIWAFLDTDKKKYAKLTLTAKYPSRYAV